MEVTNYPESNPQSKRSANRAQVSCRTRDVLNRVGDQWSCSILKALLERTHRFGELKAAIEGISPRVLSQSLNSLNRDGLIERKAYATIPPKVEYTITPLGRSLAQALTSLMKWAAENQSTVDANRIAFEKLEKERAE